MLPLSLQAMVIQTKTKGRTGSTGTERKSSRTTNKPMITDSQIIHRQYLQSPVWKAKRAEALNHYGAICGRCGRHGTDVHHKTYKRAGGHELMEDLEVVCRSCHEAHHQAERCARAAGRRHSKGIHIQAIYGCLTWEQKQRICTKLNITSGDLYVRLLDRSAKAEREEALKMIGMEYAYGFPPEKNQKRKRRAVVVDRLNADMERFRVSPGDIWRSRRNPKWKGVELVKANNLKAFAGLKTETRT